MVAIPAALGLAGLASGAGSVVGGLLSRDAADAGLDRENLFQVLSSPELDPVLALTSADALAGLGIPDIAGLARQASPVDQLLRALLEDPGLDAEKKDVGLLRIRQLRDALASGRSPQDVLREFESIFAQDGDSAAAVGRALGAAGFGGLEDLVTRQREFATEVAPIEQALADIATGSREARIGAAEGLGEAVASLREGLGPNRFENLVRAFTEQRGDAFDRRREDLLTQAQAGAFNPGAALAELEREQARGADTEPLTAALALLSGRTQSTLGALQGLSEMLAGPRDQASRLGSQRGQLSLSADQIAANQALSRSTNALNTTVAGEQAFAQGIQGGFDALAGFLGDLGNLGLIREDRRFEQSLRNKPGVDSSAER